MLTEDQLLDFGLIDVSEFKNLTVISKLEHSPTLALIYRSHIVPYTHELNYKVMERWMHLQSLREQVREVHIVDDLR